MNREQILKDHFSKTKETLMGLSARCGVHYVTLSKIKNGADCRASTWDAIYSAIRTADQKTEGAR
jgi:predicted transcriptional regulator